MNRRPETGRAAAEILAAKPPSFSTARVEQLLQAHYGLRVRATLLCSERDQNIHLAADDGSRWLAKISNADESSEHLGFENGALEHLARVDPGLPIPRLRQDLHGQDIVAVASQGQRHLLRVMRWSPGRPLAETTPTPALRRSLGGLLARLGLGLRGYFHPAANRPLLWNIVNTAELVDWLPQLADPALREHCAAVIERCRSRVLPLLPGLRSQVIYNDLNPGNVLVSAGLAPAVSGIVDFGDLVHAPLVCDVAVAAAYQLDDGPDRLAGVCDFLAAYHRLCPLEALEVELLFDLLRARLVTTTVITAWRAARFPENRDYILRNAAAAAGHLAALAALPRARALRQLRDACPPPPRPRPSHSVTGSEQVLRERRERLLGPACRLFYDRPLHIVRGEGVWLYDAAGRACLDAYNNVPLVGHSHPGVSAALAQQAATLNTHTRYLHRSILDYAERLLALCPDALDRVMFSCSGSEANELALRLARAASGHAGVIVSRHAYHGNTTTLAPLSPACPMPDEAPPWLETVPPPAAGPLGCAAEAGAIRTAFVAALSAAIERLAQRGIRPAALLLDAAFTSDGMYLPPPGTLAAAAALIREAGGLYIADEVQAGFGRLGAALWGFELQSVVPDIVTLGKSIGNGHPLAATLARAGIVAAFARRGRYFNTFGGNPVSAAVGLAVLDAFESEQLLRNSRETGTLLHLALTRRAARHRCIAEVRGSGLFAGVELRTDEPDPAAATALTQRVVNGLREQGVLIGMTGPQANVLKIRPPLPFGPAEVRLLLAALDTVLARA